MGQSGELPGLEGVLERARDGHGAALFLVGEPGAGKTYLLRQACSLAAPAFRVGRGEADPVEGTLRFGVVGQALREVGPARGSDPAPAMAAAGDSSRAAAFALALQHLEVAASRGPILLAFDDLHHADPDSLALISFLCRRISALPVAVVGTLRPWPAEAAGLLGQLPEAAANLCRVPRFDMQGLRALVRLASGRDPDSAELELVAELSHGNPLLAQQLAWRLGRAGGVAEIFDSWRRPELRQLLACFVGEAGCLQRVAAAASVYGDEFRPALAVRTAGCEPAEARTALEGLFQAGIVRALPGGSARFVHPALRRLVYAGLGPTARAELHNAAMWALLDHGIEVAEAAEHGLRAEAAGDPSAVAVLAQAGREALARGRLADARRYLEAGVAMAANGERPNLVVSLGQVRLAAGEPDAALELFQGLLKNLLAGHGDLVLARRWVARALFASGRPDDAEAELAAAAEAAEAQAGGAGVARARIDQAAIALFTRGPGPALEMAAAGRAAAEGSGRSLSLAAHATWAACAYELGDPSGLPALDAVTWRLARDPIAAIGSLTWSWGLLGTCYHINRLAERWPEAEAAFAAVYPAVVGLSLPVALATLAAARVEQLVLQGRLAEARPLAETAIEAATSVPVAAALAGAAMSGLLFESGELADSGRWLRLATESAPEPSVAPLVWARLLHLGGLHELEAGRLEAASRLYERVESHLARSGLADPCLIPWAQPAVAAHAGAGRLDAAQQVQSWLEKGAAALPARWPGGMAAGGRGHLLAARGDMGAADDAFAEAALLLEQIGFPLPAAEALINRGRALRLQGHVREARAVLARAFEISNTVGGGRLAAAARLEMQISGGRVRQHHDPTHLTPQERRIARMAGGGLSDREIARTLSISPKTVETHLMRVYRKLDLGGRRDLMLRGMQTAATALG